MVYGTVTSWPSVCCPARQPNRDRAPFRFVAETASGSARQVLRPLPTGVPARQGMRLVPRHGGGQIEDRVEDRLYGEPLNQPG
jgi:hypothetical protein